MTRNPAKYRAALFLNMGEMVDGVLNNRGQGEVYDCPGAFRVSAFALELVSRQIFGQVAHLMNGG